MPHFPTHPPFLFGLTKKHGDMVSESGASSSRGRHRARQPCRHSHRRALPFLLRRESSTAAWKRKTVQSDAGGIGQHSVDTIAPIVRRGVLLDIAGQLSY